MDWTLVAITNMQPTSQLDGNVSRMSSDPIFLYFFYVFKILLYFPKYMFLFRFLLLLRRPELQSGDVLLFYVSFSLLLFFHTFCPLDFSEMPWSNFMKPCRNIICHVKLCFKGLIFSKWLPLPWKWPKCLKIEKHKNDHSRLLAKQKLMKLDRNNIHI